MPPFPATRHWPGAWSSTLREVIVTKKPEVLVVGAGIAGPALAYWLSRNGYRPTVVEHTRQLRSGGSAIVVKGPAIPVAQDMNTLPQLRELATRNRSLTLLDPDGRRILQIPLTSDGAPTPMPAWLGGRRNSWRRSSTP